MVILFWSCEIHHQVVGGEALVGEWFTLWRKEVQGTDRHGSAGK